MLKRKKKYIKIYNIQYEIRNKHERRKEKRFISGINKMNKQIP